ncbi:HK97 gp10 family phage protein [Sphingomonas sp. PAMC 26621]|uniref:HK97 gp10 family phage protein n=1 Tax=Sphingomonas sp. PAMC 26621 TaxID=1112213 RepID=UPI000289DD22|nr:HK97 gp10 family phage protein [Sphingomonas sp. PAMC 26621]
MARSKLRGIGRFKRLLRRMPEAARGEIVVELSVTGRQIKQAIQAKAPRKSGALREGIESKVLPKSLRLQVGLLGGRRGNRDLFYGRIQDLGRKAQVVRVLRRHSDFAHTFNRNGTRKKTVESAYLMRVRAMAPKRFITGRFPELRQALNANLRGILTRSLSRIAGGSDE